MAFGFRKSKKLGLFRIGISKGGLSVSTGIKGLRVGANSKGAYTSISIPKTGIHSTQYLKKLVPNDTTKTKITEPITPSQRIDIKKVLRVVLIIVLVPIIIPLSPFLVIFWLVRKHAK